MRTRLARHLRTPGLLLALAGLFVVATAIRPGLAQTLPEVPRDRTVKAAVDGDRGKIYNIWSMYNLGGNHQNGNSLFYEPLYFFNGLGDRTYPWLAERYRYSADFKELTYTLRPGITWSDGKPFTSEDIAYTLNHLRDLGGKLVNGKQVRQFLDVAVAVDPRTVTLKFKRPAPKFHDFLSYKGDNGVFIVPKHIFQDKEWAEFTNYDPAKGYPVTTGAWRVAFADPSQRVIDRVRTCNEWWGCRTGFMPLPSVERFILLTGLNNAQRAQAMIGGDVDATREQSIETLKKILRDNPDALGWQGKDAPYGMVSWWPTNLVLNNQDKHFSKRDVRWAVSYMINRQQTIEVAFSGAGTLSRVPWPDFKGLKPYEDAIADLLKQYPTDRYDPAKAADLLTKAGYAKDRNGIWADATGSQLTCDILGFGVFSDQGPVLAEQLRRQGIKASYSEPPNAFDLINKGQYTCSIYGQTGTASGDPYLTLALYTTAEPGAEEGAVGHNPNNFYRYSNVKYDELVDKLAAVGPNDQEAAKRLVREIMAIWLQDLPAVQLFQFHNRALYSTRRWKNWPSAENPYMNGFMFMHMGMGVVLHNLQPAR